MAIVLLMPLAGGIFTTMPMPVMAGVLLLVGINMIKPDEILRASRSSAESAVFVLVLATVLIGGLSTGVLVAAAASVVPFLLGAAIPHGRQVQVSGGVSLELYGNLFSPRSMLSRNCSDASREAR